MMCEMYFVYLIECKDDSLYTGITTDVARRFREHKSGIGGHYTSAKKAVRVVYTEQRPDRSSASKREAEIKSWPREKKLNLIKSKNRMNLTVKEKRELVVKKSPNGRGIFARREFAPDETIFEVTGTFITCNEDDDIDEEMRANTYRFDEDRYISPKGRMGDFLNHSCEPNAKVVKKDERLFIIIVAAIAKGAEVVIDYSTITASDDSWEMKCNCGTAACRGTVKKFNSLPPKIRKKYRALGMVPKYS